MPKDALYEKKKKTKNNFSNIKIYRSLQKKKILLGITYPTHSLDIHETEPRLVSKANHQPTPTE